jgi:hypothetical protein
MICAVRRLLGTAGALWTRLVIDFNGPRRVPNYAGGSRRTVSASTRVLAYFNKARGMSWTHTPVHALRLRGRPHAPAHAAARTVVSMGAGGASRPPLIAALAFRNQPQSGHGQRMRSLRVLTQSGHAANRTSPAERNGADTQLQGSSNDRGTADYGNPAFCNPST